MTGNFFCFFFLLLLVVDDNDSFRIAVHITLMGRSGRGRAKGSSYSYSSACVGCVPFGCWRARIRVAEWEGGRERGISGAGEQPRRSGQITLRSKRSSWAGGGDRCPPRRERSHGRVSGTAGGEKCSSRSPHRRYIGLRRRDVVPSLLQLPKPPQLCHNRRSPRKSRHGAATSLTAGGQSAWVQSSSSSSSSWDGVGRFFLRVSKLFGSQPR